jgi:NAD(P)-dependent dehydrogenase (short-subunit alcohol dehydrogenase family)
MRRKSCSGREELQMAGNENQGGFPPQQQEQPGLRSEMEPKPRTSAPKYRPAGKLEGKAAIVTGGDSGIGRAVSILFAREGADVAILYLKEHRDAEETRDQVEKAGRRCILIDGDVGDPAFCRQAVAAAVKAFGKIDILVNNAGEQHAWRSIEDVTHEQLEKTFKTNIFSMFYMVQETLPHMGEGGAIINSSSVTAYQGHPDLLDYSATKGAIVAFTRSISLNLIKRGIRVNGVAPGPVWTPLIPASFDEEKVSRFGLNTPMGRAGQPDEIAPCYVFLASDDSSYMNGQMLHPNGGRIVNG